MQAVLGGESKELTDAANKAFGLRDDDRFVSPAVQRMAAMAAKPPPAGAAKKADGSDPTSAADAMRSKGGKNSGGAAVGNQYSKGHQNALGRRTGVRKCGICGKEGHYAKTCSKSKEITSFFDPA